MIHDKFVVGKRYSRANVGSITESPSVATSQTGPVYILGTTILFVTLDKRNKPRQHKYNDYFDGDHFHWDSQNIQHQQSPRIIEIMNAAVEVVLFARIHDVINGATERFTYCGRLVAEEMDPARNKPVHIRFKALDYDPIARGDLGNIFRWRPPRSSS